MEGVCLCVCPGKKLNNLIKWKDIYLIFLCCIIIFFSFAEINERRFNISFKFFLEL